MALPPSTPGASTGGDVAFGAMRLLCRRRAMVALAIATVLAGAAAAPDRADAGAGAGRGASKGPSAPPKASGGHVTLGTPVLSIRRVPDWIEAATSDARLALRLPALMAKLGPAAASSCLEVRQAGITLFADRASQAEIPASNMKVLTATALLDKLAPTTRLRTRVTETGRIRRGVLDGNLYLVGGGDPLLRTPGYQPDLDLPEPVTTSLPKLAEAVKAAGIKAITGQVIGDEHLFDSVRAVPTWKPRYIAEHDVGPLSALEVNDGFSPTNPFAPAAEPAVMAAQVFAGLLRSDGVDIKAGPAAQGVSPASARPVASILSPPLSSLIDTVLTVSDNTGAELLTKLIGQRAEGAGSTAAGTEFVRKDLASDGLPVGPLRNLDGSGLDAGDRVSCGLMVDTLDYDGTKGVIFAGLPIAGQTGTLASRMKGTPAAGRVHAKTGTLDTVSTLSGFVMPKATVSIPQFNAPITFSFISNNLSGTWLGVEVGDAIAAYLARGRTEVAPIAAALPRPLRRVQA
jgi:D-alanyl-D-alanine carboxypeptidase/D-alanyl-D-alanine-endopeptidase (penicillin-binding protein 4)